MTLLYVMCCSISMIHRNAYDRICKFLLVICIVVEGSICYQPQLQHLVVAGEGSLTATTTIPMCDGRMEMLTTEDALLVAGVHPPLVGYQQCGKSVEGTPGRLARHYWPFCARCYLAFLQSPGVLILLETFYHYNQKYS